MGRKSVLGENVILELYVVITVIALVIGPVYANQNHGASIAEKKHVARKYVQSRVNAAIVQEITKHHHLNVQFLYSWLITGNITSTYLKTIRHNPCKIQLFNLNMKLLFINCQSFKTAYGINDIVDKYDIDLLCLNETFENTNNPVRYKNWNILSSPRPDKSRGGAVICIKPSLNYVVEHVKEKELKFIEMTCVKITFKHNKTYNVWCPYIPPEKTALMEDICKHLSKDISVNTIIVGDLNAKSFQWNNVENRHGKMLEECMTQTK